jgi:mono/diheme cytochrome c family protein
VHYRRPGRPADHWRRGLALLVAGVLVVACGNTDRFGTAWGDGAFESNGERIYFTATSERGTEIDSTGGPSPGGMMMGGRLSCGSCHGTDARGGLHTMHMDVMEAPNIRWVALTSHRDEPNGREGDTDAAHDHEGVYDLDTFRLAITDGLHPDAAPLSDDMPRWEISEADVRDLAEYLQSFSGP